MTHLWWISQPTKLLSLSKIVTDLANEISLCKEWDPKILRSPAQPVTPIPIMERDDVPIATACKIAVRVPVESTAWTDGFIDNLIMVSLDMERNNARESHSVLLAIHVTSCSDSGSNKPITHPGILLDAKLIAKGNAGQAPDHPGLAPRHEKAAVVSACQQTSDLENRAFPDNHEPVIYLW
jgi:hypothetical protein